VEQACRSHCHGGNIGLDDSDIVAKAKALACGTAGSLHDEKHTTAIITTATTAGEPLQHYLGFSF
jgi:hypothetical protein